MKIKNFEVVNKKILITLLVIIILILITFFLFFKAKYLFMNYRLCGSFRGCVSVGVDGRFGKNYKKLGSVREGEEFEPAMSDYNNTDFRKACEKGLVAIEAAKNNNGSCSIPLCPCLVCTKCGDGICGSGENKCNCKNDCGENK
jgi:hypothetical protein